MQQPERGSVGQAPQEGGPLGIHRGWAAAILAAGLACWAFLVWMAVDMGQPLAQLAMPDSAGWGAASALAVWAMWALMMAAMMLPSALPMVLAFTRLCGHSGERARALAFVAAYLLVWWAFSAAVTAAQWAL